MVTKATSDKDLWNAEIRTYVRFEMHPPLGAAPSEGVREAGKRSLGHNGGRAGTRLVVQPLGRSSASAERGVRHQAA